MRAEAIRYLATTDLFRDFDEETFKSVEQELEWVTLETGELLMRQGEVGDSLWVVLSGRLRVFIEREDAEVAVGEISPGEAVGEMAIIAEERRSATVRAIRPSTLIRLTRTGFDRLEARHPQIMRHMARLLVRRLRDVNVDAEQRARPLTIGIVGGTRDAPASAFANALANALSRLDTTRLLNRASVDAELGTGSADTPVGASDFTITNWLSDQERRYRFVVYEADEHPGAWTYRVSRHADRILIVVPADGPHEGVQSYLAECGVDRSAARKEMVLAHSGTNRVATGTARWLDQVPVDEHYHVWLYSSQDFDRMARIIAGQATGLVLGGGGARGFAHIGVIRALQESGIPIDFVGGTSIGALIAAECALEWDSAKMIETNREVFRDDPMRGDYTLPMISIVTARKSVDLYGRLFGEKRIEDQCRNYFAVACNLTRGELVVQRRGLFRDCVKASSALPAVGQPVFDKGDMIVDGAVMNNLPGDVMKKICGGRVIAVDVSPRRDLRSSSDKTSREAWEGKRIHRAGHAPQSAAPNSLSVVMRTIMLNSVLSSDSIRRQVYLYLKPPIDDIEMFDWMAIEQAAEIGYRYAIEQLQSM